MNSLPKRRKPAKMHCNEPQQIRSAGHLAWIRGFECSVNNANCEGKIEAAHVRTATNGGTSMKPGDNWTIPLCAHHHAAQHRAGEKVFERVHKFDMKTVAADLWLRSPHRHKLRTKP